MLELKKKFGGENKKLVKVAKLKKVKQKIIESYKKIIYNFKK